MKIQVFQGTDVQQFQNLQQEGRIFTIQPVAVDGRNVMTSLRRMNVPLQPLAQVVDDVGRVRGLSFAIGNGIELYETGSGYTVSYNGQDVMTLKQSTEDGIGVAEMSSSAPANYVSSLPYAVEQAPQPSYQEQPYPQPPYNPGQPYQEQPYPQPPYNPGQPYPAQPAPVAYQNRYDPMMFGAPVYPGVVPYVDYHDNHHLLQHYYDRGHDYGWGHHGGFGHMMHDMMDHDEHH